MSASTSRTSATTHHRSSNWSNVYRPRLIKDIVLPSRVKTQLLGFVDAGACPNLILSGPPGSAKTTTTLALSHQLNLHSLIINGAEQGTVDIVRTTVRKFATQSLAGLEFLFENAPTKSVIIIEEADCLHPFAQKALQGIVDSARDCIFMLTCNERQLLIPSLQSRLAIIDFDFSLEEKSALLHEFVELACTILDKERVEFDKRTVEKVTYLLFPDFRRTLMELEAHSATGTLNSSIIKKIERAGFPALITAIKAKQIDDTLKWLTLNSHITPHKLMRTIYELCLPDLTATGKGRLAVTLAKYAYWSKSTLDQEINLAGALAEIMANCEFRI